VNYKRKELIMAQSAPYQGSNVTTIHPISTNAFGATAFTYDKTIDSTIEGHPIKQDLKIMLTNKTNNEAWNTHLKSYLTNKEVTVTKVTYEDGTLETVISGTDTAKTFGVIWYDGAVGTKRKVVVGAAVYAGTTGNAKTVYGNIGDMPVEIQFVDWGATLTIGSDLLDTDLVTPSADIVLVAGEIGHIAFLNI